MPAALSAPSRIRQVTTALLAGALLVLAVGVLALVMPTTASADVGDLDSEELTAIRILNETRMGLGLTPLTLSPILTEAAEWMSDDLAIRGFLSHTDSLGRGLGTRVHSFGYPTNSYIRENIAYGYLTGAAVMNGWMNSTGHRTNNLATDVVTAGISRVQAMNGVWYWTLVLGSHEDPGTIDAPGGGDVVTPTPTPTPTSTPSASPTPSGTPPVGSGPGMFASAFPPFGIGLNVWNGGTITEMAAGAGQGGARSVFVSVDGELLGYVIGAPPFVNEAFMAAYPAGVLPPGTGVIVVMGVQR